MLKGILLLYALGASPVDQPIRTTGWAKLYPDTELPVCISEISAKASELNVIYAAAELKTGIAQGRWVSACVKAQ